jgi:hypothetical protein
VKGRWLARAARRGFVVNSLDRVSNDRAGRPSKGVSTAQRRSRLGRVADAARLAASIEAPSVQAVMLFDLGQDPRMP